MAPKTAEKQGFVMTVNKFKLSDSEQKRIKELFIEFNLKTNSKEKIAEISIELSVSQTNIKQFISFLRKQNYNGVTESLAHSNEHILKTLNEQYNLNPSLAKGKRAQKLAAQLGVKVRRVTDYFQKRRDNLKKQNGQKTKPTLIRQPGTTTRHVKSNSLDDVSDSESESEDEEYAPPKHYAVAKRKRILSTPSLQASPAKRARTETPSPQNTSQNIANRANSPDYSVPPSPAPEAQNDLTPPEAGTPQHPRIDAQPSDDIEQPTLNDVDGASVPDVSEATNENEEVEIPIDDVIVKQEVVEEEPAENIEVAQPTIEQFFTNDVQDWMLGCQGNVIGRCWFPRCTKINDFKENEKIELAKKDEPILDIQECETLYEYNHKMRYRHGLVNPLLREEFNELFTVPQPVEQAKSGPFSRVLMLTDWRLLHLNTRILGGATVQFLPAMLGTLFFERLVKFANEVVTGGHYHTIIFAFGGTPFFGPTDFKTFWDQFTQQTGDKVNVYWTAQDWTDGLELPQPKQDKLDAFNKFVKEEVKRTNESGLNNYKFVNIREEYKVPLQKKLDAPLDEFIDTTPLETLYCCYSKYFTKELVEQEPSDLQN